MKLRNFFYIKNTTLRNMKMKWNDVLSTANSWKIGKKNESKSFIMKIILRWGRLRFSENPFKFNLRASLGTRNNRLNNTWRSNSMDVPLYRTVQSEVILFRCRSQLHLQLSATKNKRHNKWHPRVSNTKTSTTDRHYTNKCLRLVVKLENSMILVVGKQNLIPR